MTKLKINQSYNLFFNRYKIQRSATFTTRSAISNLLNSAPTNQDTNRSKSLKVPRTKTWCGPLDNTLLSLVGDKCSNSNLSNLNRDSVEAMPEEEFSNLDFQT